MRQAWPADCFEVVVVPNGCTDGTSRMLAALHTTYALRVVEIPQAGISGARNAGAAAAAGRVLLFLDDDIEASHGCLAAHVRAHEGAAADVVAMGPLLAPRLDCRPTLFVQRLQRLDVHFASRLAGSETPLDWLSSTGGNMSVTAALFARAGGFDRELVTYGSEDWEFGIRAQTLGARFVFLPDAGGYHHGHEHSSVAGYLRNAQSAGRNDVGITRRHPQALQAVMLNRADRPQTPSGRLGRWLAFDHPRVGDVLAGILLHVGHVLACVRWDRGWNRLMDGLHQYWYFRGAGIEIGDRRAIAAQLSAIRHSAHRS